MWEPTTREINIEVGCLSKIYILPNQSEKFTKVLLQENEPRVYKVLLKSPSLKESLEYHMSEIILSLVLLIILLIVSPYAVMYFYALKKWAKIKKEINIIKNTIRNIEQDYFHRRIDQNLFNRLIKSEQQKLYRAEAEALKIKKMLTSVEFLKHYKQKKKR